MPPTISVTVGRLDAAAAFEAEVLEPAALLELLPELLQAARPAARAATPAMLAILIRVGLGIEGVLLVIGGGGEVGWWGRQVATASAASAGDGGRQDSRRRSSRPIRPSAVSETLAAMPRPRATVNSEPRTIRGMALAILMYGLRTSARKRNWPSSTPTTTPAITPKTKPSTASLNVVQICSQIEP